MRLDLEERQGVPSWHTPWMQPGEQARMGSDAAFYDTKVQCYSDFRNPELLSVVRRVLPRGGRVLDIGCASGGLLAALAGYAGHRAGLEVSPAAAAAATGHADQIVCGSVEDEFTFEGAPFDVVVCADVLEHLADPLSGLRRAVGWLAENGAVVVSVPNIANWQARTRLLRGVWHYEPSGIWDSGHLRFFTVSTLTELLEEAGMQVDEIASAQALVHQVPSLASLPRRVQGLAERVVATLACYRPTLFAFQLVAIGRLRERDRWRPTTGNR